MVLTGGPGAGKTATLELVRQAFCAHVVVLPEAAGILFRGGFPRNGGPAVQRAVQRAIFHIQRALEATADPAAALVLCDRGTIDGAAYWPGPGELWPEVGTTHAAELRRYDAVIHLRTPAADGYDQVDPLRPESATEAAAIDARILAAWAPHPRRFVVEAAPDFLVKAAEVLALLRAEVPACCRGGAAAAPSA